MLTGRLAVAELQARDTSSMSRAQLDEHQKKGRLRGIPLDVMLEIRTDALRSTVREAVHALDEHHQRRLDAADAEIQAAEKHVHEARRGPERELAEERLRQATVKRDERMRKIERHRKEHSRHFGRDEREPGVISRCCAPCHPD